LQVRVGAPATTRRAEIVIEWIRQTIKLSCCIATVAESTVRNHNTQLQRYQAAPGTRKFTRHGHEGHDWFAIRVK